MNKKLKIILLLLVFSIGVKAQFYSFRTNLTGLATTNINAEFSMTLDRKWSLHFPIQYNPFVFGENRQFRNLTFQPGVRYWFLESYSRNFWGVYALASRFHIGNIWDKYRYDGKGIGLGTSYGHAYALSPRWNIEWELGVSFIYADYDKYRCKKCGAKVSHESGWFIIPSRIAVNMVYLF